jgi:hypothetical protein
MGRCRHLTVRHTAIARITRSYLMDIAKLYARVFGFVALLIGILGFVPGISSGYSGSGYLLGIFAINPLHNIIHILTGLVGIFAGYYAGGSYARMYALAFGIVYTLVTILGFTPLVMSGSLLGLIPINLADNLLHIAITVSALLVYFISGPRAQTATA